MRVEWPTLWLIIACYALWAATLFWLAPIGTLATILLLSLAIALQSSLQHEVLHGHPFPGRKWGVPLVYASLNLAVPYGRFRDTHLAHHRDSRLTDPYDDPESNFLDPAVWAKLSPFTQRLLAANNTLLGRIFLGPIVGQISFMRTDWALIRAGNARVLRSWLGHMLAILPILWLVWLSPLPFWAYLIAAYLGLGLLKIRTFLEHRAHEASPARTVVVEDRGFFALLFLNNNFHAVHHQHPTTAWYHLPALYHANREAVLTRNEGYVYRNYAQIFRRHAVSAKDPVPHPLWPRK